MGDTLIRGLERAAAAGDRTAAERLEVARRRRGDVRIASGDLTRPAGCEVWGVARADIVRRGEPEERLMLGAERAHVVAVEADLMRERDSRGEPATRIGETEAESAAWRWLHARIVRAYIRQHGPIPAARCSSAPSVTSGGHSHSYWGAVRYEVRLRASDDEVIACALSAARTCRSRKRLAERDAEEMAERIGGVVVTSIGELTDRELAMCAAHAQRSA